MCVFVVSISNLWTSSEIQWYCERPERKPEREDAESPSEACDTRRAALLRHQGLGLRLERRQRGGTGQRGCG